MGKWSDLADTTKKRVKKSAGKPPEIREKSNNQFQCGISSIDCIPTSDQMYPNEG